MAIASYNLDPELNTVIGTTDIAENCNPDGVNNAIRQMMADIAAFNAQYGIDFGRTLTVPIGEVGSSTPNVAGRANKVLLFDNLGNAGASGFSTIYAGTQAVNADSRTILANMTGMGDGQAAMLTESGREGVFVWHTASVTTQVTADPRQGIFVAPSAAPTGASGAWVRKFSGKINVKWFGVVGDGVTNDSAAFTAAIAISKFLAGNLINTYYIGGPGIFIPAGKYYLGTTTLEITHTLTIEGEGNGQSGGAPTMLIWAAGASGIRVQRYNTSGDRVVGSTHNGGDGTVIRGLYLLGGYTASNAAFHGIDTNARVLIQDCAIKNWQGNGINILANSAGGSGTQGNANGFAVERCMLYSNQYGILVSGSDANAGYVIGCDIADSRVNGVLDSSFLGNTYIQTEVATSVGAPLKTTDANARCVFLGCYAEGGQPACSFANGTIAIGGLLSETGVTGGTWIRSEVGQLRVEAAHIDTINMETLSVGTSANFNSNHNIFVNSGVNAGLQTIVGPNVNFGGTLQAGMKANNTATGDIPLGLGGSVIDMFAGGAHIAKVNAAGLLLDYGKTINFTAIISAVDDAAAAAAGVPVGSVYRNGSILMTRVA